MDDIVIRNATLHDRPGRWQVAMADGRFTVIAHHYAGVAARSIDADGHLLLPGLLEVHTHIDKTYTFGHGDDSAIPEPEALREAIRRMWSAKQHRTPATVEKAARRAFDRAISFGISHLRSHIDVGEAQDLDVVHTLVALRDEYRNKLTIEYTALGAQDTPWQSALLRSALAAGVDCVGGAPALSEDPVAGVTAAVEMAERNGKPLDLHIDENETPDSPCLETLADLVIKHRLEIPVMASHCCSLGYAKPQHRARVLGKVRDAGIALVTLPACNLVLMGRRHDEPRPRGMLPFKEAHARGITVCIGTDNVGDPFQPWGDYDPLRSAALAAHVAHVDDAASAFAGISTMAASALRRGDYGLAPGCRADCSLLATGDLREALAESPLRTHVFFGGRLVLHQQLQQQWM